MADRPSYLVVEAAEGPLVHPVCLRQRRVVGGGGREEAHHLLRHARPLLPDHPLLLHVCKFVHRTFTEADQGHLPPPTLTSQFIMQE